MFNGADAYHCWSALRAAAVAGDRCLFEVTLADALPRLEVTKDELRLLHYIALHLERWAFRDGLEVFGRAPGAFRRPEVDRLGVLRRALAVAGGYARFDGRRSRLHDFDAARARHRIVLRS
ncbi:MAG: hypothetical protein EBX36_06495 [Planctomycetia bacterium]|nr:hypothetical protein [Planctomycetia bacterium]